MSGQIDPAGPAKDGLEAELEAALVAYWAGLRQRIQEEIEPQVPAERKGIIQLALPFWKDESKLLLAILLPFIQRGAEGGVAVQAAVVEKLGIGVDWTLAFTQAARWAREHVGELVTQVTEVTKERIRGLVTNWIEEPGRTLPDLWRQLMDDHAFSRSRAKLIAMTETTKAYAEGELAGAREMAEYFDYVKEWQTANDDRVCDICGPLQGERVDGIDASFSSGDQGPPAHPGCRCWINTIPQVRA